LASSPCVVSGYVPFLHGHRLPRQLDSKSLFSLRYHWPTISDRWRHLLALRRAHDPRQHPLGLDVRPHRHRHRVSAGMAVWEASGVLTVEKSPLHSLTRVVSVIVFTPTIPRSGSQAVSKMISGLISNIFRAHPQVVFSGALFRSSKGLRTWAARYFLSIRTTRSRSGATVAFRYLAKNSSTRDRVKRLVSRARSNAPSSGGASREKRLVSRFASVKLP
jgi:hypothetical protein